MMAQEERVLAMVRAGTITEDEGQRLISALRPARGRGGVHALIDPYASLSTGAAWAVAAVVTAVSIGVGRLGIRFDGALDLHRVSGTPAWSTAMFDAAIGTVVTAAVLWVVSLAVARHVRLMDFVLSVAIARMALVGGGVVAHFAIPDPDALNAAMVASLTTGSPIDPRLVVPQALVVPFFVWFIALLYQGFRTSSGTAGRKAIVSFTLGIIAAELVSKLALAAAAAGFVAAATGFATSAAYAQPPASVAGTWSGSIETPAVNLAIVVRLQQGDDGAWSGTIDIPQQRAKGVALADVVVAIPNVSFRITGAPGDPTIRVTVSADGERMSGTLAQGGGTVPVTLVRGDAPPTPEPVARRPQTPARPFPYLEEEVTFRNESAGVQLAGTLTLPRAGGPFPAAILITGSGQQDRDETILGHKPFLVWADHLTRRGMAVLRVDDRGIGGSARGPLTATSEDFADDVRAAVAFLRRRSDVDVKRIGLIGHSEGALLAAMVAASSPDLAFIVMLAGPGLPGDQILSAQAAALLRSQGGTDAAMAWDRSLRERVFAIVKSETDGRPNQARRQALLDEVGAGKGGGPGIPDGAAARSMAQALLDALSQPWLRFFIAFDPRPTLRNVRAPVLAIGGDKDIQVSARANLPEIERAVGASGNADVTVVTLPNLNHLLQTSATGMPSEYATIEETIAPAALQLVSDWLAKRTALPAR